jgi:intracellular sulfur oxidation DsrE/DsrF family protein
MKKILFTMALAFGAFLSSCNNPAAEPEITVEEVVPSENYFVLNRNVEQLKAIGKAAGDMAAADGAAYGEFNVVVCGKAVTDLVNAETMAPLLEVLNANNVHLIACGFSLKKFEVEPANLPEGVTVVPNGITYGFEQLKSGAHSITL